MQSIVGVATHDRTRKLETRHRTRTKSPHKNGYALYIRVMRGGEPPQPPPDRYAAGCSQERAAEMSQQLLDTRRPKPTADAPQSNPSAEAPPTSA